MPRPKKDLKPLTGYRGDYLYEPKTVDLLKVIYEKALKDNLWIFDPSTKRWFDPEEFWEHYQRFDNLPINWIDALQIKDPEEGLKAADHQIESILARKAIFAKRIIDYWRNKNKTKDHH